MLPASLSVFTDWQLIALVWLTLVASIIRGYAGFGMSALLIGTASLIIEPRLLVPVLYALEVMATLQMLPGIVRSVDWRLMAFMAISAVLILPISQYLLLTLAGSTVRVFLGSFLLVCAVLSLSGWRRAVKPGPLFGIATGSVFGVGSGLSAIGGLGASLMLIAMHPDTVKARATGMLLFAVSSSIAFPLSFANGLAGDHTLPLLAMMAFPMFIGVAIGSRLFLSSSVETFRKRVMLLIAALATCHLVSQIMNFLA